MPDLVVVTVAPAADIEEGFAFVKITKVAKGYKYADHPLMVETSARGWKGLAAWWPYAVASALVGGAIAWFAGRWLQVDDFAAQAEHKIKKAEDDLAEATQKLMSADSRLTEAKRLESEYDKFKKMAESAKAAKIAAEAVAAEAERKLVAERERHKEELNKAGARFAELKKKMKKQELDTD